MESILTDATCGEACWTAKEELCKCSCGGHNHGCLNSPEGYLQSTNGRNTIANMAKLIKQKEGRLECKYFLNLLIGSYVIDI